MWFFYIFSFFLFYFIIKSVYGWKFRIVLLFLKIKSDWIGVRLNSCVGDLQQRQRFIKRKIICTALRTKESEQQWTTNNVSSDKFQVSPHLRMCVRVLFAAHCKIYNGKKNYPSTQPPFRTNKRTYLLFFVIRQFWIDQVIFLSLFNQIHKVYVDDGYIRHW